MTHTSFCMHEIGLILPSYLAQHAKLEPRYFVEKGCVNNKKWQCIASECQRIVRRAEGSTAMPTVHGSRAALAIGRQRDG